jgi:poly(A) polymerase
MAPLLLQIPPARLFDEVLKLFMAGYGLMTFRMLSHYGLFGMLFPEAEEAMADDSRAEDLVEAALTNTDRRIADGRPVTPAFLLAAFLWAPVVTRKAALENNGMPSVPAMQNAAQQVISRQLHHTSIPKRFGLPMRDIWELQERLAKRQGKRAFQTREHPRFRAAYDLLLLREQAGEIPQGLGEWWTAFQAGDEHEQRRLLNKAGSDPASQGKRRKRRQRKPRNAE